MANKTVNETRADGSTRTYTRRDHRRSFGRIERRKSGRYAASYVGPDGQRHRSPMTYKAKAEADAWLTEQQAKIIAGTWTATAATEKHERQAARAETFGDYGARWIENSLTSKGLPLKPATKQGYRSDLRQLAAIADKPLTSITGKDIEAIYRAKLEQGKKTTASKLYSFARVVLNAACEEKLITENPCKIKGANNVRTGKETEGPTDTELAIITANVPDHRRAMVTAAAWSAFRYGELTELRRKDIEDDGEQILITVSRGVTYIAGRGTGEENFIIGEPKTAQSKRQVWLPPGASQVLRDHLAKYVGPEDDALLFAADNGGHLKQSWLNRFWYPAREAAGRPNLTWHSLRHYGLTQYARNGATAAELMARGGHSNIKTAMRYQDIAQDRDRQLAARMENR